MKRIYLPTYKDQNGNELVIKNDDMHFDSESGCERFIKDNECREICRILNLSSTGWTSIEFERSLEGVALNIKLALGYEIETICISGPHYEKNKPVDAQLIEVSERPKVGTWVEVWIEPYNGALSSVFKRDSDGKCYLVQMTGLRRLDLEKWANDPEVTNRKFFVSSNPPEHKDGGDYSCGNPRCKRNAGNDLAAFGKEFMDMITRM